MLFRARRRGGVVAPAALIEDPRQDVVRAYSSIETLSPRSPVTDLPLPSHPQDAVVVTGAGPNPVSTRITESCPYLIGLQAGICRMSDLWLRPVVSR